MTKAAILLAYSLNVGNLRDTGHLVEVTPPAAMADNRLIPAASMTFLESQPPVIAGVADP